MNERSLAAGSAASMLMVGALLAVLVAPAGALATQTGRVVVLTPVQQRATLSPTTPATPAVAAVTDSALGSHVATSTLAAADACPAASPGAATCDAQLVVSKSTGAPAVAVVAHGPAPQIVASRNAPLVDLAAPLDQVNPLTGPAAASPPQAGTPAYFQQAYDLSYLAQTAGSTDTVAIVDAYGDSTAESDLATYRSYFGLPACTTADGCFRKTDENGGTSYPPVDSGWALETSLDLDTVSAICPLCHIDLVEAASSSFTDLLTAENEAHTLGANQISNSFSGLDTSAAGAGGNWSYPGVAIVASTGDGGYISCGSTPCAGYPAAMTTVTAAGGTSLAASTTARGFTDSAWSGSGSGCDTSASKPTWQTDTGCTGRTYSDLSADADPNTGMLVYDNGGWMLVGGTSEASPMIAAYYALIGSQSQSIAAPHWAYANAAYLNDPATGSNGSCPTGQTYVCDAGPGYDGPTGIGSISGDVVTGAPGIGGAGSAASGYAQNVVGTSTQLRAGVYPNGLDTTYWWQYGTTTAYGQTTTPVDIGAGATAVSNLQTLSGLSQATTYHIRLVAQNSDGTSYGYDTTFTTTATNPPVNTTAPSIGGTPLQGTVLTANVGTWNPAATSYSYQWERDTGSGFTNISGATDSTYTVASSDGGSSIEVVVTGTNGAGSASATSSSVTIVSGTPLNTVAPTITGTVQRGSTLSVSTGTWSPAASSYAYQWQRSSGSSYVNITSATAATYTTVSADVGHTLQVVVTGTNSYGDGTATATAVAPVTSSPPVDTTLPTVTGTAQRGSALTATAGAWNGAGNGYAYQWQDCNASGASCTNIVGQTSLSYTLGKADETHTVRIVVTATNPDATVVADSAPVGPIVADPPLNTTLPTISGTAERSYTLTGAQGSWSGAGNAYAYQWQDCDQTGANCTNITKATSLTYTLAPSDDGDTVRFVVMATNTDASVSADSAVTTPITAVPPQDTTPPSVTGNAARGSVLTANLGVWVGIGNTYAYQWQSDDAAGDGFVNIPNATAATYTPQQGDEGSTLRVLVTATNPDGTASDVSAATAAVAAAPPVNTTAPTVSGTAKRGSTLTATQGAWSGVGNAYSYEWEDCDTNGANCTSISGATATTYAPAKSDEGDTLRVLVSAVNPDATVSQASAPTAVVGAAPPVNTALPTVSGTAHVGSTLAASTGSWSPTGPTLTYQWQHGSTAAGYTNISGATGSTYVLAAGDNGLSVRVVVTATNVDGSVSATSAATVALVSPPQLITQPAAPSGTLMQTFTLVAMTGTWDNTVATFSYTWVRCPSTATSVSVNCITVGAGGSYTLAAADVGHLMAVDVTATSHNGSTTAASVLSGVVQGLPLTNSTAPYITGTPTIPQTLTANAGSWSVTPTSVTYAWERCDSNGQNCTQTGTASTYTLSGADQGHTIMLVATANSPGRTTTADSQPVTVTSQPKPSNTVAPAITGTAQRTMTLHATAGNWTDNPTLTYQWERCPTGGSCTAISGATASSYQLALADEGDAVTVVVTATDLSGTTTATATPTAAVAAYPAVSTRAPAISGTPEQGGMLMMSGTAWQAPADVSYSFAWKLCNAAGQQCQAISGATAASFTPTAADVGGTLVAEAIATDLDGPVVASSPASAVVLPAAPRWTTTPRLSSDPGDVGDALTVTPGTWSGGPPVTTDTTKVMRCTSVCKPTSAAPDATSYTIGSADVASVLRVEETATNAGGTTIVWSSRYVGPVTSAASGSAVLSQGAQVALRNSKGATLATAKVVARAGAASTASTAKRVVSLRRAAGVHGALRAYATSLTVGSVRQPATAAVTMRGTSATLMLPAAITGKVLVVVSKA